MAAVVKSFLSGVAVPIPALSTAFLTEVARIFQPDWARIYFHQKFFSPRSA